MFDSNGLEQTKKLHPIQLWEYPRKFLRYAVGGSLLTVALNSTG
ncbi:hypothetical protein V2H45_24120 [Tumidithrix elongata RA019]|uniref:Uncharacterized protein n=1 Tax=Tumidithrix elongata BACA0141 TaxID=2716417 RepID=A0AAW9Q3X4_9CYAN|nr:hypothetical protein [Tumidithrix elongata RA019]